MKIYLIRHTQSKGNADPSEYFRTLDNNIGLTEKGEEDARKISTKIVSIIDQLQELESSYDKYTNFKMFYSSYKRTIETATIIRNGLLETNRVRIDGFFEQPLLHERRWGSLRDIVASGNKTEEHFDFFYQPNSGESFSQCYQRAVLFHQHLLNTSKYEHNIVVAHGEFNKLYLMYLLGWSVKDFERYKSPRNGEVFLIDTVTGLSGLTPLTVK